MALESNTANANANTSHRLGNRLSLRLDEKRRDVWTRQPVLIPATSSTAALVGGGGGGGDGRDSDGALETDVVDVQLSASSSSASASGLVDPDSAVLSTSPGMTALFGPPRGAFVPPPSSRAPEGATPPAEAVSDELERGAEEAETTESPWEAGFVSGVVEQAAAAEASVRRVEAEASEEVGCMAMEPEPEEEEEEEEVEAKVQ